MVAPDKGELDLWKRCRCLDKPWYQSKPAWQVRAWKGKPKKPENITVERRVMGNKLSRTSWTCYVAGVASRSHILGNSCWNDEIQNLTLLFLCIMCSGAHLGHLTLQGTRHLFKFCLFIAWLWHVIIIHGVPLLTSIRMGVQCRTEEDAERRDAGDLLFFRQCL